MGKRVDLEQFEKEYNNITDDDKINFVKDWSRNKYGFDILGETYELRNNKATGITVINYESDVYDEQLDSYMYTIILSDVNAKALQDGLDGENLELEWRKYLNQRIPNYTDYFRYIKNLAIDDYVNKQRTLIEKSIQEITDSSNSYLAIM